MATKKKETPKITDTNELKTLKKTQFIETGNIGIDIAFSDGKGIPMGTNIMFFGLPGTGKTTIFCDIIRRLMERYEKAGLPMRVHYVDSESSRDLLESTGVMKYVYDPEEYAPYQVIYHEHVNAFKQLENIYLRMLTPKDNWGRDIHFVFIDSVTKLLAESQLDLKNGVDKADFGDNARARKKLYGKWLSNIQAMDITQFWSVQMAQKQNVQAFEDPKKPAVSEFDKHNMDIIVKLTASKDTKRTDINKVKFNTLQGEQEDIPKYVVKIDPGQAAHTKNRHGQNLAVDVMLWRGKGIVNAYMVRRMLEAYKLVSNEKDIYTLSPELVEFLGPNALEQAGITDVNKVKRSPTMNKLCSYNADRIIEWFKAKDIYKMKVGVTDVDDGLYI